MKTVGVREFNEHVADYSSVGEMITVGRDGEPIGYYIPIRKRDPERTKQALEQLERAVQRALDETGMTEDELADLFDVSKPFPYDTDDGESPDNGAARR